MNKLANFKGERGGAVLRGLAPLCFVIAALPCRLGHS